MKTLACKELGTALQLLTHQVELTERIHKESCSATEHSYIGLTSGRRGRIFVGDEGQVCYEGDLFEAVDLGAAWDALVQRTADDTVGRDAAANTKPEDTPDA